MVVVVSVLVEGIEDENSEFARAFAVIVVVGPVKQKKDDHGKAVVADVASKDISLLIVVPDDIVVK